MDAAALRGVQTRTSAVTTYGARALGRFFGCIGLLAMAVACAAPAVVPHAHSFELTSTPFFPQTTDQCGPAALASALTFSGSAVSPETLREEIHLPDRAGSLQVELVAATRRHGRIPYVFQSRPDALLDFVYEGHPVVVLQNLGVRWRPVWHYAVVVGFDAQADRLVLRSGARDRHLMKRSQFDRTWRSSNRWALVVLPGDTVPKPALADEYVAAVAGVEAVAQAVHGWQLARKGYSSAIRRWPDNGFARLGLGNVLYGSGDRIASVEAYEELLTMDPGNRPALNNLAHVYAELGRHDDARALRRALERKAAP